MVQKTQATLLTKVSKVHLAIFLASLHIHSNGAESQNRPKHVRDPVLHLRFLTANPGLDPLSQAARSLCIQIADNANWTGRQWLFGVAKVSNDTYYLATGYFERRQGRSGAPRFFIDNGGLYRIRDGKCSGDPAGEAFRVNDSAQIPPEIRAELARDLVTRLVRAVGGKKRLRAEIAKQHIDFHSLPPEFKAAFGWYFTPAD